MVLVPPKRAGIVMWALTGHLALFCPRSSVSFQQRRRRRNWARGAEKVGKGFGVPIASRGKVLHPSQPRARFARAIFRHSLLQPPRITRLTALRLPFRFRLAHRAETIPKCTRRLLAGKQLEHIGRIAGPAAAVPRYIRDPFGRTHTRPFRSHTHATPPRSTAS